MARIAGIDLPKHKRVVIGLTSIFGIGKSTSLSILSRLGINADKKVQDLTDDEVNQLRNIITGEIKVEGALKSEVQANIKRLIRSSGYVSFSFGAFFRLWSFPLSLSPRWTEFFLYFPLRGWLLPCWLY